MDIIEKYRGNLMTIKCDEKGSLTGRFVGKEFTGDLDHIREQFFKHVNAEYISNAKRINKEKGIFVNNNIIINK